MAEVNELGRPSPPPPNKMIIIFSAFFPSLFRETKAVYLSFFATSIFGEEWGVGFFPIFFPSRRQEKQIFLDSRPKKEEEEKI